MASQRKARFAALAHEAGAHGLTVHPRPDERHIRPHDVTDIAKILAEHPSKPELNIEGNPLEGLIAHVERVRPAQCTTTRLSSDVTTSFAR